MAFEFPGEAGKRRRVGRPVRKLHGTGCAGVSQAALGAGVHTAKVTGDAREGERGQGPRRPGWALSWGHSL